MNHPGDLLVDLVDGTLSADDRALVEAHLETCATCRSEVALATQARAALDTLAPVEPPASLADAAIAEAVGMRPAADLDAARAARRRGRWLGIAAAAAVVALIAVAAPKLGSSPSGVQAESAAGAGAAVSYPPASGVDVVGANLSPEQLAVVAAALGGISTPVAAPAEGSGTSTAAATTPMPALDARAELPERLPAATACLDQAFDHSTPGVLTRVLLARFDGTPAYFGLYAVGPGAGLAPTRLQLLAASVDGCSPLGSAYALLPRE
jgi:predicted anti-sigma-YlaC factor YlaD